MNYEKEDLLSAISRLRQGITNLNKEGRQRLLASFDVVNKNFEKLFFQLFAGGHAHMKLVDSDDPLKDSTLVLNDEYKKDIVKVSETKRAVSPSARKLAQEKNINLDQITIKGNLIAD